MRCGRRVIQIFTALNDLLQYLGFLAFHSTVPGLQAQRVPISQAARLGSPATAPSQRRAPPESDVAILREIGERLGVI